MRPGAAAAIAAAIAAIAAATDGSARADSRPPQTTGIALRPGQPGSLYVRSTLGLLVSHDAGCSFRWICQQAIGYGGDFDPKYAIDAGGTIYATTFSGLRVSRDGGCTWEIATADLPRGSRGALAAAWIDAIDIAPNGDVWIATAESARPNDVYRSTDAGQTFQPRNRYSASIWWKSVKVAPTDARRVYLSGYQVAAQPPTAHLLRTDDAGETWRPSALAGVELGPTAIAYVAAVDPASADTVFLTALGASPPGDRLYRSTDAGATFREVLATTAPIRDVVFRSADEIYVATVRGAFHSGDRGASFAPLAPLAGAPQLACLAAQGGRLVGCGANWEPDRKAVARSDDAGGSWQRLLQLSELAGPLACAPGTTVAERCGPLWPQLQQALDAKAPVCPAVAPPPIAPPPPRTPQTRARARTGGGCCDSGSGPDSAAALLAWLGLVGLARRPRALARRRA